MPSKTLEAYLARIYQEKYKFSTNDRLTDEVLKAAALSVGMSEAEWEALQKEAEDHYFQGKVFAEGGNLVEAVGDLEQAVAIKPNYLEALCLLADCTFKLGVRADDEEQIQRADARLEQALQVDPRHQPALQMKNAWRQQLKRRSGSEQSKRKQRLALTLLVVGLLLAVFVGSWISLSNKLSNARIEVDKQWAQVENVQQRRERLVPQIYGLLDKQPQLKSDLQDAVEQLKTYREMGASPDDPQLLAQHQRLSQLLQTLSEQAQQSNSMQANELALDALVQLEGAENRVWMEVKRYNDNVSEYNARCETWPTSMLLAKPLPYYQPK